MERTKENVVSCYFTYMQDGWCEEECRTIFGARAEAVWIMWCKNLSAGASGSGLFYLALDKDDKIRLVDRAVRFVEKRIDDESQLLVCDECGSREIQMMAWVDPNTSECTSTIDADSDDRWCDTCQEHVWFCFSGRVQAAARRMVGVDGPLEEGRDHGTVPDGLSRR